jgi:hypothetical protein
MSSDAIADPTRLAAAILRLPERPKGPGTTALVGRGERRLGVWDLRVIDRIDIPRIHRPSGVATG